MDVHLPDMSGPEATRQILLMKPNSGQYAAIPALTAHALSGDRERGASRCTGSGTSKDRAPLDERSIHPLKNGRMRDD